MVRFRVNQAVPFDELDFGRMLAVAGHFGGHAQETAFAGPGFGGGHRDADGCAIGGIDPGVIGNGEDDGGVGTRDFG